jgi:hypothetical protein
MSRSIHLRARCTARNHHVEPEKAQPFCRGLDRASPELLLHGDPLEILVLTVIDRVLEERSSARRLDDLRRHERLLGTSVASKSLDQRHRVCPKPEGGQQSRGGGFGGYLPSRPVFDADFLPALEEAIELRRRTPEIADREPTIDL